jgi:hypothetical protein
MEVQIYKVGTQTCQKISARITTIFKKERDILKADKKDMKFINKFQFLVYWKLKFPNSRLKRLSFEYRG